MDSGTFGSNEIYQDVLKKQKPKLARRLMSRELGRDGTQSKRENRLMSQVTSKPSHNYGVSVETG